MDATIPKHDDVPADSSRRWKKRKNPWSPKSILDSPEQPSSPVSAFVRVTRSKPASPKPTRQTLPNFFGPIPQIPGTIRVVIPGPVVAVPVSSTPIHNQDLLRENYAIIMQRMFYTPPKQERLVQVQMIKKPRSYLNLYYPYYGRVILPVLEVPSTYTVWIQLDSRKIIRAPLDHFRIVNQIVNYTEYPETN